MRNDLCRKDLGYYFIEKNLILLENKPLFFLLRRTRQMQRCARKRKCRAKEAQGTGPHCGGVGHPDVHFSVTPLPSPALDNYFSSSS
jgi:hypothetical protein